MKNNKNTNSSIVDEKSGLRSHEREDRTNGSSPKRVASFPDLSPQDEFATTKICAFFAMILLAIVLDQAIKFWILDFYANALHPHSALNPHGKVFESPFIDIILVFNKGVAFSFLSAVGANLKWIILAMLVLMLILVLSSKELFATHPLAFGLIIGGGFSNLIDRFFREGVVDYIFWHYKFNFAVFNLADSIINVAIAWIILRYIFAHKSSKNPT